MVKKDVTDVDLGWMLGLVCLCVSSQLQTQRVDGILEEVVELNMLVTEYVWIRGPPSFIFLQELAEKEKAKGIQTWKKKTVW